MGRVLGELRACLGERHPRVADAHLRLAETLRKLGRVDAVAPARRFSSAAPPDVRPRRNPLPATLGSPRASDAALRA